MLFPLQAVKRTADFCLCRIRKMSYKNYFTWKYPDIPENVAPLLQKLKTSLVIVGVIGRSKCPQANKMSAFGMEPEKGHQPTDGGIMCYYKPGSNALLLHFETTYDETVMEELLLLPDTAVNFDSFYGQIRSRFLRLLLLALHVCHIVVYVETAQTFDPTLATIFRLLKYAREQHLLEFLPKMLRDGPASCLLGSRLCTPRMLFLFENYPADEEKTRECISAYEFQTEDNIYKLLLHYNIVTNSSTSSLLALPNNKQFVFYNSHEQLRPDHLLQSLEVLYETMRKPDIKEEDEDSDILALAPFEGFVRPYGENYDAKESDEQLYCKEHTVWHFLDRHVQDALDGCFDEGSFKQVSQNPQFQLLSSKDWHLCMATMYKLLIGNALDPNCITNNDNYKVYLQHFSDSLNYEKRFWTHLCEVGLKKGISVYKNGAPAIYSSTTHKQLLADASLAFEEEGRGPYAQAGLAKLTEICQKYWLDGRQQCEVLSLRGKPCTHSKDVPHDKHSTGVWHISSCNCGRTQGRREDPFSLRQANYDYYEHMASMCNLCLKVKKFQFPLFAPSTSDYRAAAFEEAFPKLLQQAKLQTEPTAQAGSDLEANTEQAPEKEQGQRQQSLSNGCSQPMSATYGSDLNMSIAGFGDSLHEGEEGVASQEISSQLCSSEEADEGNNCNEGNDCEDEDDEDGAVGNDGAACNDTAGVNDNAAGVDSLSSSSSTSSSIHTQNEMVLQLKESICSTTASESLPETLSDVPPQELVSTTEYLPGLVHKCSGCELLPLFPSWSLACVGPSSIYSHNTGLQEHFQSGFLSGANFLLPWDVQVRLVQHKQHQQQLQQQLGKKPPRYRKHGDRLSLKIFVGFEYECSRGHRFMMCSPDRILRGGADIERDTSTKVINNNMPLYFPCPCGAQNTYLAQLMRVHVVTPKAPVNIIVDPKVLVGKYTFILGCNVLPKLTQSAYWILRLPYVYQGDDVLITPPEKLESDDLMSAGCLLAGMFSIAETEPAEPKEPGHVPSMTFTRL